jgi:NAD(P)H-flavin reductase
MITANLCVLVFLALRNTPLSFLIGYSYERLNVLHQAAGYTTVMFTVLHGVLYTVQFMAGGRAELLRRPSDVAGIVSGFAMAVMFIMPTLLKGSRYEVFYISHVTSFIVIIITAALHQRELAQKVAIMTIVAGALWASDRLVRAGRTIFNARGNTARLYPLPSGGTRVVLARTPACAVAGQHCFLWIPAARKLETHPFSIVTTTPNLEFVVSCRDGFTKSLRALAVEQPGVELRASMDGPYGTFPDPLAFDRVVLIAGGNGASFAFGVLSSMLGKMADHHVTEIEFTWAVRERAHLRWYESHLEAIRNHARASKVDLTLHITRDMEDSEGSKSDKHLEAGEKPLEPTTTAKSTEANEKALEANEKTLEANEAAFSHVERVGDAAERSSQRSTTKVGRPEIKSVIQLAASRAAPHQRVLVMACGPKGLMKDVRNSVAANLHPGGPSLELHCEQFGW